MILVPCLQLVHQFLSIDALGIVQVKTKEDIELSLDTVGELFNKETVDTQRQNTRRDFSELEIVTKKMVSRFEDQTVGRNIENRASFSSYFQASHWTLLAVWVALIMCTTIAEDYFCKTL